ncbi:2-keto-4-pentenoate hydratase [Roseomonas sp. BN140053]|uniref:2-keto-4-pentenoate hydratase n=1 Tax=Roseomonas sp. BN140053 TaxID=3391898 RepID=UPI0039EAAC37
MTSLAEKLAAAFAARGVLEPEASEIPTDLAAAEAVQDAVVARTVAEIGAWKLGATVRSVREGFGLPRGFFGVLPASRVLQGPAAPAAADLPQFGLESEIAFRFGRDLGPAGAPWSAEDVRAAILSVHPSIEVPQTRYPALGQFGGLGLIADNGATGLAILGEGTADWTPEELIELPVQLEFDGREVAAGTGELIEGGPFGATVAFVALANARGYTVKAGQYVLTGSCTGYLPGPRPGVAVARFGRFGQVEMRLPE